MRITIDMPDDLYRRTKAVAALRGVKMKDVIIKALEQEITSTKATPQKRVKLPLIKNWKGPKLDLSNFDFDELLG
jgi:hypothetical protein